VGVNSCKVCDDKVTCRLVDEELAAGRTYAYIARYLTLKDWPVHADTIGQHAKHRKPVAPAAAKAKRDLAALMRDEVYDRMQQDGAMDLFMESKHLQGAVKVGLLAEKQVEARDRKGTDKGIMIALGIALGGGAPPPHLLEAGDALEGEYVETDVDPD